MLEGFIREAAGDHGDGPLSTVVDELVKKRDITAGTANGLRGLEHLRNMAVEAPGDELLASRVGSFVTMAKALRWSIEEDMREAKGRAANG